MDILLSITIFSPVLLGLFAFLFKQNHTYAKRWTLISSLLPLGLSLFLLASFDSGIGLQFKHVALENWLGADWDTKYIVALDGISACLFFFSVFLFPLAILASFRSIKGNAALYGFLILLLETSVLGVFASLDLLFFYLFWELLLVPIFFLTIIWGNEKRERSAFMFFIYMFAGSLLMLLGIIYLAYQGGLENSVTLTTDYQKLIDLNLELPIEKILFWLFAAGFLVKAPLFPFHTWLPSMYRNSPPPIILLGIVLKMATYGLIRFNLILFPNATFEYSNLLSGMAVVAILYGGIIALKKNNMFDVLAYSSISHLGFILLGIFSMTEIALQGALLQMISHGLSTGVLLLSAHYISTEGKSYLASNYGGLKKKTPFLATTFLIGMLAAIGLPGLSGFVGEFLILLGSWQSEASMIGPIYTSLATLGIILSAGYMLPLFQKLFLGSESKRSTTIVDIPFKEKIIAIVLVAAIAWIGISPNTLLSISEIASYHVSNMTFGSFILEIQ